MALAIMDVKSSDRMQDTLCTRVNRLRLGRDSTEIHRCESVSLLRVAVVNSARNMVTSSRPATGIIRSICPSSSSTANHSPHMKMYLQNVINHKESSYHFSAHTNIHPWATNW